MHARIGVVAVPAQVDLLPVHAINRAYVSAVRAAGGLPFILPTLDPSDATAVVAELDGLVLSGGGDLDPASYGGTAGPALAGVDAERDQWELALVAATEELGVPVLGVCRGLQAINVAAGGTLVPHLPDCSDHPHRVTDRDREPVHSVTVVEGSLLHGLTGPTCGVNSLHHQAADRIGTGLRAVGFAPDGIIEALEDTRWGRTLGVQWHPELLAGQPEQTAVWNWLIDAAAAWSTRRTMTSRAPATSGQPADLAVVPDGFPATATAGRVA